MEKTELPGPRTAKIETVTDRELSAIEGGLNGTPCLPGTFLTRYLSKKLVKMLLETQGRSRPCGLFGTFVSLSLAYMFMAKPHCRRLFVHWMRSALDLALASAGNSRPARIAMIAITTSSSIKVNARRQ